MTENKGNSTVADAAQFGRHMKHGGWELALLVARNVYKSKGSGSRSDLAPVQGKVTPAVFAKMAGVSARTVDYYYEAWQLAADRSDGACVTPAGSLKPGQDDSQSINDLVDEDDPELKAKALQELWSYFYRKAKGKLDKPKDDPKPVVEPPSSEIVEVEEVSDVSEPKPPIDDTVIRVRQKIGGYRESVDGIEARFAMLNGPITDSEAVQAIREIQAKAKAIMEKCDALVANPLSVVA